MLKRPIAALLAFVVCTVIGAPKAQAADAPLPTSVVISTLIENFILGQMEALDPPPTGTCPAPDAPGYQDAIQVPMTPDVYCPSGQSAAACILLEYLEYLDDLEQINKEYKWQYCRCACCWDDMEYQSAEACHAANGADAIWKIFYRMTEYGIWIPPAFCCMAVE